MGKSYDVWSKKEHRVIGTIYENEDYEEKVQQQYNEAAVKYLESKIRQLRAVERSYEAERKYQEQKELILSKMSDSEKADYEKNIRVLEEKEQALKDELENLRETSRKHHETNIKRIKTVVNTISISCTVLYALYMFLLFIKQPDISGVIFISITSVILYFVLRWVGKIARWVYEKIDHLVFWPPVRNNIVRIEKELKETQIKKHNYIYNYSTESTSP